MAGNVKADLFRGMRDGLPIALGYFAVSVTLGIAAVSAGMNVLQASAMSALNMTSAGELAGISAIALGTTCFDIGLSQLVINLRYMLMSCAISQKLVPGVTTVQRMLMSLGMTDEIFGVAISQPGRITPHYFYGVSVISVPMWTVGTCIGAMLGEFMPPSVSSALGVALYGMFIAVVVPPARTDRPLASVVVLTAFVSWCVDRLHLLSAISPSLRLVLIIVLISGFAAIVRPVGVSSEKCECDVA